jgi:uncharacterized protein (UPF0335 family)
MQTLTEAEELKKLVAILEDRIDDPNVSYEDVTTGKTNKVIANLHSYKSATYTKLAQKLEQIEQLEKDIKQIKEDVKQGTREDVADLFDAEDATKTRVIDTISFIFQLTKDPEPTTTYKWAAIIKELEKSLTPQLIEVLSELKKKYQSETQKSPALSYKKKEVTESFVGNTFNKLKSIIERWAIRYDSQLGKLKAEADLA